MTFPDVWLAMEWWVIATAMVVVSLAVAIYSYRQTHAPMAMKVALIVIRVAAILLLAVCLLEPMFRYSRPEPGANLLMLLVDDSQSLQVKDKGASKSRGQQVFDRLNEDSGWQNQLAEVFDLRRYQFDQTLRPVSNFTQYQADRRGTDILGNLKLVSQRFADRPAAGLVVLTDGNDLRDASGEFGETLEEALQGIDWESMPPIFPVVVGGVRPASDLGIDRVTSTQTNFESAPVTIEAELIAHGFEGKNVVVELLDETGESLEKREIGSIEDERLFKARFQTKPQKQGINVYQIRASLADSDPTRANFATTPEATLVNNLQSMVVNRGRGPYRVLYVCGRPNWELKFLNRAINEDPEVDLVSLVRIAKREAKFTFLGRDGQQSNSLFRGFESQDDDTTEQHDEPVFLRLGTRDGEELRGGFPKDAEDLFVYDGIILDDVEAEFFNEDQKSLLQEFVSVRGGGLLMIGGQESFAAGGYDQTAIGEMMPVYLDRLAPANGEVEYKLDLTREGWLQPWVRVRPTEIEERQRLAEMPGFQTINRTDSIKPGASVLATVSGGQRENIPALVVQPFGTGRVGAMLVGDLWRWHMHTEAENDDQFKAWRQMVRWLVADVPRRVELSVARNPLAVTSNEIRIEVRDEAFVAYDSAKIELTVITPDGKEVLINTNPSSDAGVFVGSFSTTQPGVYRAVAKVKAEDGSDIETREYGWVCDPDRDEFRSMTPNRRLLQELADRSKGELLELDELANLPNRLESRPVPMMIERLQPWWHRWFVLAGALALLVTEWGVRRWKGMP